LEVVQVTQPAGTNTLYVFVIDPALKGADYTIGNILYDTFEKEGKAIETLYIGFRDSLAQGLNLVNLQLMHDFSKDAAAAPRCAAAGRSVHRPDSSEFGEPRVAESKVRISD
jgi:hypothetical protein